MKEERMILRGTVIDSTCLLRDRAVIVEGEVIRKVVPWKEGEKADLGGRDKIIMPGIVNVHTHAAMMKFHGLGHEVTSTDEWLRKVIWPAERRWRPREVKRWAEAGLETMVSSGCTTVNDHYFFADEVAKAAEKIGLRAFVGQTIMDTDTVMGPVPRDADPEKGFRFFERWRNRVDNVTPTMAPHATNTVSLELMKELSSFVIDEGATLHVHVAQSMEEVMDVKERYGITPVEYLSTSGALKTRLVAAHGIYVSRSDLRLLRSSNHATIVICPTSNLTLEGRIAPLSYMRNINLAIGTDFPSPMDPFLEMRRLWQITGLAPVTIIEMATLRGAKGLGIKAGLVRPGYLADLIVVRGPSGRVSHDTVVMETTGRDVEATMVGGNVIHTSHTVDQI